MGEQVFTDVYWDTEGCGLTERDWWLRSRAGRWELKVRMELRFCWVFFAPIPRCLMLELRGFHVVNLPPIFGEPELDGLFPPGKFQPFPLRRRLGCLA